MESFFTRYRNLVVLAVVLVAQIMGLAIQVRRHRGRAQQPRRARWIGRAADPAVGRCGGFSVRARHSRHRAWRSLACGTTTPICATCASRTSNCSRPIDRLRLEQAALLEDAKQGQRLQALLNFQQKYIYTTLAAQAIGSSGSDQSHVFYIDKGADYKLKPDMAVITADGIVGKVRDVFPHTAQVLAINDQTSGAGVILETTRIRGILRGDASGRLRWWAFSPTSAFNPAKRCSPPAAT